METLLTRIVDARKIRLDDEKRQNPAADLEARISGQARDVRSALQAPGLSVIAEFKRRSPSAGDIAGDRAPAEMAKLYEEGGAAALSVLTESDFFGGSLGDLRDARDSCSLPVLRKDFVLDPYQVIETRAEGGDAILLIAAVLVDGGLLADLADTARDLGLAAIVEVHEERELDHAFKHTNPSIIGINQRDLRTFEVDTGLVARMRKYIPDDVTVVAESGISSPNQMRALRGVADAALIGESLMRSDDPISALRKLMGEEIG